MNTHATGCQQTVDGFYQGEAGEKQLRITLTEPGEVYTLHESQRVVLFGKKPDGTMIMHDCTIENGKALYTPTTQTLSAIGTVQCQLVVYHATGQVMFAPEFALQVAAPLCDEAEIISSNEFSALQSLMMQMHSALTEIERLQNIPNLSVDEMGALLCNESLVGSLTLATTFDTLPLSSDGQLAYVVESQNEHPKGFYVRLSGQWSFLSSSDTHTHENKVLLDSLSEEEFHIHPNKKVLDRITEDSFHIHDNELTLQRLHGTENDLSYSGKPVMLAHTDSFRPLSILPYNTLLIRENPGEVPVYITENFGFKIGLYADEGTDGDFIDYTDVRDSVTGMPVGVLRVQMQGQYKACFTTDYHFSESLVYPAGWYDENNTPTTPPVISSFAPEFFKACGKTYRNVASLPPKEQSALESLSHMVNVSVEAMGDTYVPEGVVERFAGILHPGHTYATQTLRNMTISFPSDEEWTKEEKQIVLYITAHEDIDLIFPENTLFVNGVVPETPAGHYKFIFTREPCSGQYCVGVLSMEESS